MCACACVGVGWGGYELLEWSQLYYAVGNEGTQSDN